MRIRPRTVKISCNLDNKATALNLEFGRHHHSNYLNAIARTMTAWNTRSNDIMIHEIRCIDSLPYFKKFLNENNLSPPYFSFDNDGHYTKLGHSVMADFLLQELFNNT